MRGMMGMAAALAAGAALAQTVSVKSPDGRNEIRLNTEPALSYEVLRDGAAWVKPTAIGLAFEGRAALGGANAAVATSATVTHKATIPATFYKKARVKDDGNETLVAFKDGWAVRLHARNDGVAWRFETSFPDPVRVTGETGGLTLDPAWKVCYAHNFGAWKGDAFQNSWEAIYGVTNAGAVTPNKLVYLPLLVTLPKGGVMCVTESDLRDYPGWNLAADAAAPGTFKAIFAKVPKSVVEINWGETTLPDRARYRRVTARESFIAATDGTRTYPWRVFQMADGVKDLPANDIVYALAAPCRIDTKWVKPGKVAWDWWNDWNITGVDFRAGCNTKTYEYYIDFAARHRVEYVIFDEGWSEALKIMKPSKAVDVAHLVKYGENRGVGIILWCAWAQLDGRQQEVFSHYAKMGVKGFKIDFMDRDDQTVERFLEETARVAAEHKLLVDYHGMHKPTGLQRTYPNIVNYEGVHGLEQSKWQTEKTDMPRNDLISLFVRMSAGPLDYTPGAMLNYAKGQFRPNTRRPGSQGTRVHQMALMSLYEAPLQMLCDSPTQYILNPQCFGYMAAVPTVWDDTVGLAGDLENYALVARRRGTDWWLAGICGWAGKTLEADTSFLGNGTWDVEIFADGVNADRDATDCTYVCRTVKAGEKLKIKMMPGGGWTARFTPAKPWWRFW